MDFDEIPTQPPEDMFDEIPTQPPPDEIFDEIPTQPPEEEAPQELPVEPPAEDRDLDREQTWLNWLNEEDAKNAQQRKIRRDDKVYPRLPDNKEAAKQLVKAEKSLDQKKAMLEEVKAVEARIRENLKHVPKEDQDIIVEEKLKEYVDAKMPLGGYWDMLKRLWEDTKETTSPRDQYKALIGDKEYISPLQGIESFIADPLSPSKWTAKVKNPREKMERIYSSDIMLPNGHVNLETLYHSDMPRDWQNYFTAYEVAKQTGLPIEIWTDIIEGRQGYLPTGNENELRPVKRTKQMLDSVVMNAWSNKVGGVDEKIALLKRIKPPFTIFTREEDGVRVFDMPGTTADGMATDAQEGDTSTPEIQQKLWADFVGYGATIAQDESLSNLSDVMSAIAETVVGIALPPVGAVLAKTKLAKVATAARRAGKARAVEKMAVALPKSMTYAYKGLQGDFPVISTIARMSPKGRRMGLELIKKNPKLAGVANAADRLGTIAATHAALGYMGSGDKSKEQSAIGAAMLSIPMNTPRLLKDSFHYNIVTKFPKAYKEIARTDRFENLSSFTQNLIKNSGMEWEQVRADQALFKKNTDMILHTALQIEQGVIDDKIAPEIVDYISKNPEFRAFADAASGATTEGMGIAGRYNKIIVDELIKQLKAAGKHVNDQEFAASANAGAIGNLTLSRMAKSVAEIPADMWSDTAKLFEHFETDPRIKPYATEIKNRMEDRGFGVDLAYNRMAAQMLQVGIIIHHAKETDPKGMSLRLLREMAGVLANPGPELKRLTDLEKYARHTSTVTGFKKVDDPTSPLGYRFEISEEKLPKISPRPTVDNILKNPDLINDILDATDAVIREYSDAAVAARGSGKPALNRAIKERVKTLRKKEQDFVLDTTMDLGELIAREEATKYQLIETNRRAAERITAGRAVAKILGLNDSDVAIVIRAFLNRDIDKKSFKKVVEKYPKPMLKAGRSIATAYNRNKVLQERHVDIRNRIDEVREFTDSRGNNFIEAAKRFEPSERYWNEIGMPDIKEIQDSPYWQSLTNKLAYDMVTGIEETGVPTVNSQTMKMLRALEHPAFVLEIAGGFSPEEVKSVTSQATLLAKAIHRQTGVSRIMNDRVKRIQQELDGITDSEAKRSMALMWMRQIRRAYKGVYSLKSFVKKYEARLEDVANKITEGVQLTDIDKKLLYTLTKSSAMSTYRMRNENPDWIVPLSEEAAIIYPSIEKAGAKAFDLFMERARLDNPDITNVEAAVMAGRFLGLSGSSNQQGFLGAAILASKYFRRGEEGLEGFDTFYFRELLSNQDNLAAFMSRETATGIDRVFGKYGNALQRAKMFFQRQVADGYLEDLRKIPGYLITDYGTDLSRAMRKFAGYGENYEWPVLDGQITEFGVLLRRHVVNGEDLDKIFDPLGADAMLLSDVDRPGPRSLRFQLTERDARLDQLDRWKRSIKYYWAPDVGDPKVWKIAFEVQKVTQKWDRKSIEIYNELTKRLNKEWGTNYGQIEYQPYRLDGHMRNELDAQVAEIGANALQTMAANTATADAYTVLMGKGTIFGRNIQSSREGQLHKIRNLQELDVDDVRNNFLLSKELLFTHAYTRDSLVELRDLGIRLKDTGYSRYANAVARSALRHYANIAPQGTRRFFQTVMDSGHPLVRDISSLIRVAGAVINPFQMLATIRKTFIDNPTQWMIMALGSSINTMYRIPVDSVKFLVQYPIRIVLPDFSFTNPSDLMRSIGAYGDLTPEAAKAAQEYVNSTRKVERSAAERSKMMVNWNTRPAYRSLYWWGGRALNDPLSEQIQLRTKDNSEVLVKSIVTDHAVAAYTDAVLKAQAMKGRPMPERVMVVRGILAKNLKGTGIKADISETAVTLVNDVDKGAPYRGLGGYMFQVDSAGIGRFDPLNIPPLVVAMDRTVPGTATFFSSIYNTTYRTFKLMGNMINGNQAESAFVALLGLAAWIGTDQLINSMQEMNDDGTGYGPMKLLERVNPMQMFHSFWESTKEGVRTPAMRVGAMDTRFWAEMFYRIGDIAWNHNSKDYHMDRQYEVDQENQERVINLFKLLESSTPLAILQDFVGSPISVGWHYFVMDPEFVKEKLLKEMRNDPTILNQFKNDPNFDQKLTPEQMRVFSMVDLVSGWLGMVMPIGSDDINPVPDEKWADAQLRFRMALGKLGIGPENELLYTFATGNRREVETLLKLYGEMKSGGEAPFPKKPLETGVERFQEVDEE